MKRYFNLITFSHTIFALPFALAGFTLGYIDEHPADWPGKLVAVIACMVFARSAAMAFNRWLDRDIDAANPRTVLREIPAGFISAHSALRFVIIMCILFTGTTWLINPMCFILSPVALLVILGYSFTKRFTPFCHVVLGLGLGLAPIGAYLAVTGYFAITPVLMGVSVLLWVAGFDIIYALQDEEFDRSKELYSIPVWLGRRRSMRLSEILHLVSGAILAYVVYSLSVDTDRVGVMGWSGLGIFLVLLVYQHTIIRETDLSRVNRAFFTTNGIASVLFGLLLISDLLY